MKNLWQRGLALWRTERIQELFRYCVIGGLTTLVSFGTLWLFENLLYLEANLANILSILCAVTFAYVTNKLFVFRTHVGSAGALLREAASFFAARGVTMLVEAGGFFALHSLMHLGSMWAKLAISVVVLVLNYVLSKLIIFRKKKE